jgi:hypothetical protein
MSSSLATLANESHGTEAGECPDLRALARALASSPFVLCCCLADSTTPSAEFSIRLTCGF